MGAFSNVTEKMKEAISRGDLRSLAGQLRGKPGDLKDEFDETLLMHAALAGKLDIVRYLVEKKQYAVNKKSLNKANALIRAALSGNLEVVSYLVEKGADLNANESLETRNACGYSVLFGWESHEGTALHAAIAIDSLPITEYLIGKGADPGIKSPRGHTAFEQAVRYGRKAIIAFLAKALGITLQDQVIAAARLNEEILKYLVNGKKAEIDFQDAEGMTPLLHAIRWGDYEFLSSGPHPGNGNYRCNIVEFLLKKGADARHRNAKGQTALMFAALQANSQLISLLVQYGADPGAKDLEGKRAIDYIPFTEAPDPSSENAYEAWCWENSSLEGIQEQLRTIMAQKN